MRVYTVSTASFSKTQIKLCSIPMNEKLKYSITIMGIYHETSCHFDSPG